MGACLVRHGRYGRAKTMEQLDKRAKRGSVDDMLDILNKVPDVESSNCDKL